MNCGKFPTERWLQQLEFAAGVTSIDERSHLGEHLAEAVDTHPARAIAILDLLIRPRNDSLVGRIAIRRASTIIAHAVDSDDPETQRLGRHAIDRLGRLGNIAIGEQVEQERRVLAENGH